MESRNSRDAKASRQPGGWEQRHLRGTLADLEQGPKGQQEQKRGSHVSGELPHARGEEGVTLDGKERAIARDSERLGALPQPGGVGRRLRRTQQAMKKFEKFPRNHRAAAFIGVPGTAVAPTLTTLIFLGVRDMKRLLSWSAWLSLVWLGAMCVPMLAPSSVSADEIEPPEEYAANGTPRERADLIPEPGGAYWDVKCSDLDRETIPGFYAQLLANHRSKPVVNAMNLRGCVLRTTCDVTGISPMAQGKNPFDNNWWAELQLSYLIGLQHTNPAFGMSMSGATATIVDKLTVRGRSVKVGAYIEWLADEQHLMVITWDLDDPRDYGPQCEVGEYLVTARSTTSTLNSKQSVALNFSTKGKIPQEVSVSGSTYVEQGQKRLRIVTDGVEYAIGYGIFSFIERKRNDGTALCEIGFAAELMTDADLSITQTAQEQSAECSGRRGFSLLAALKDAVGKGELSGLKETQCGVVANAVPYAVTWDVWPVYDADKQVDEGNKAQVRWVVDTATNTGYYQPLYRQGLSYKFSAAPANGVKGATILINSNATTTQASSKRYYPVRW
jgi:hypothetical protein